MQIAHIKHIIHHFTHICVETNKNKNILMCSIPNFYIFFDCTTFFPH